MKKIFVLFFSPVLLFSCLWVDGTTLDGEHRTQSGHVWQQIIEQHIKYASPQQKLEEIQKDIKLSKLTPYQKEEHHAVIDLLKGNTSDAIKQLLSIEKKYPNHYSVAANLGTAYELNGENHKALKWINEGISRNPKSHYATEWLHIHILQLKIKQESNPKFLKETRAIPLPETFNIEQNISIADSTKSIGEIKHALEYQLRERTIFVKPKDTIVADLLYTLARISAQTSTVEEALKYLELSQRYGFSDKKLLSTKKERYQEAIDNRSIFYIFQTREYIGSVIPLIIFISFFLIVIILLKRLVVKLVKLFK